MLYSYKGLEPAPIPERIRLSNGSTRTDSTTFTEEEITDAGYVLAEPKPEITELQHVEWDGSTWVIRELTDQEQEIRVSKEWVNVREKRNSKLQSTDWMVLRGLEQGQVPENLIAYRQALRDITTQADPFNLSWPTIDIQQTTTVSSN